MDEQQIKRELNKQRIESMRANASGNSLNNRLTGSSINENNQERVNKAAKGVKNIEKGAAQLVAGNKISGAINTAKGVKDVAGAVFSGDILSNFGVMGIFMLFLAMAKDTFDMISLETLAWIDWIFDLVTGILLWVYLSTHGARKTKIVKFATPILEMLPFSGFIPWWTIGVIYAGLAKKKK